VWAAQVCGGRHFCHFFKVDCQLTTTLMGTPVGGLSLRDLDEKAAVFADVELVLHGDGEQRPGDACLEVFAEDFHLERHR